MLNKKAITNQESQLFTSELEKFRPHQNRILQAVHKQSSLMKELTRTYSELLQDKRVKGEQNKYEAFSRQRNAVLSKYRKVFQAYKDLQAGLARAQSFYDEMKETVDSLKKNVDSFVENRRSEGGQLLSSIEASKGSSADREQARMKELMERMSLSPSSQQSGGSPIPGFGGPRDTGHRPPPLQPQTAYSQVQHPQHPQQTLYNPAASPPITPRYQPNGMQSSAPYPYQQQATTANYNPNQYGQIQSPPAHQQYFSPPPNQQYNNYQQPSTTQYSQQHQSQQYSGNGVPQGWQPPPPPPGPPPSNQSQNDYGQPYPNGPGGYVARPPQQPGQQSGDPWAGLSAWK